MLATTRKPRKAAIVAPEPVKAVTKMTIPAASSASEVEEVEEELEDLEESGSVEARTFTLSYPQETRNLATCKKDPAPGKITCPKKNDMLGKKCS